MITKIFFVAVIIFFTVNIKAATVDTISIYSTAMHKEFKCVVIKPGSYKKSAGKSGKKENFPVVYLLHGYGGWYSNWLIRVPQLKVYADEYNLMIVCPDGGISSWYFDSPVDSTMKYETYIGKEVPGYIDTHYNTINYRSGRAITGLSMGGHGGLFIGLRHTDFFGGCGSMSGAVNLAGLTSKFDIVQRIGDTVNHAEEWKSYSVMNLVERPLKYSIKIIIDCGTEDFLYNGNLALHEKMLKLKIPHEYIERPGKHEWPYWRNAVQYQLLFFANYFKRL